MEIASRHGLHGEEGYAFRLVADVTQGAAQLVVCGAVFAVGNYHYALHSILCCGCSYYVADELCLADEVFNLKHRDCEFAQMVAESFAVKFTGVVCRTEVLHLFLALVVYEHHLYFVCSLAQSAVECYRSEEHTSELQSRQYLVCRLLLEKK